MKLIAYFILLFITSQLSAQRIVVNYTNVYDMKVPMTRNSKIVINPIERKATYFEDFKSTKMIGKDNENAENQAIASVKRSLDKFFITDADCNRILYDNFASTNYLVKDTLALSDWKVEDNSKMIANYRAYRATCTFRGRNWVAWFTPEIPFPFGPWKLCGLPGLILEAHDENRQWNYSVSNINLNSDDNISLPDVKGFKIVSLEEFVKLKDEFYTNFFNSIDQNERDATIKSKTNLRAGVESSFEWENKPKTK